MGKKYGWKFLKKLIFYFKEEECGKNKGILKMKTNEGHLKNTIG